MFVWKLHASMMNIPVNYFQRLAVYHASLTFAMWSAYEHQSCFGLHMRNLATTNTFLCDRGHHSFSEWEVAAIWPPFEIQTNMLGCLSFDCISVSEMVGRVGAGLGLILALCWVSLSQYNGGGRSRESDSITMGKKNPAATETRLQGIRPQSSQGNYLISHVRKTATFKPTRQGTNPLISYIYRCIRGGLLTTLANVTSTA